MTRIIGGRAKGRRLQTPAGDMTRPTSDRVREALFSAIESAVGSLSGLRFLDLYAGSGAVGLEAWSRGAGAVTLVEQDRRTAALVRANAVELGCPAEVITASVPAVLRRGPSARYDVVFLDPPYALDGAEVSAALGLLVEQAWLCPDALVIVERSRRASDLEWPSMLRAERQRRYGETVVHYGRHTP